MTVMTFQTLKGLLDEEPELFFQHLGNIKSYIGNIDIDFYPEGENSNIRVNITQYRGGKIKIIIENTKTEEWFKKEFDFNTLGKSKDMFSQKFLEVYNNEFTGNSQQLTFVS